MTEPKLTGFLISLIMFGFFVAIFGMFYSDIGDKYGVDYNNDSVMTYQKMNEVHDEVESYQEGIETIVSDENIVRQGWDIAGGILSSGISSLKIAFKSIKLLFGNGGMADSATTELGQRIGKPAAHLRVMLSGVVLILIFFGILLPVIIRWGKKL